MPSFDIVSKTDLAEVDNALANIRREIETRFDFKGTACSLARKDDELTPPAAYEWGSASDVSLLHFAHTRDWSAFSVFPE